MEAQRAVLSSTAMQICKILFSLSLVSNITNIAITSEVTGESIKVERWPSGVVHVTHGGYRYSMGEKGTEVQIVNAATHELMLRVGLNLDVPEVHYTAPAMKNRLGFA